MVIYLRRQVYEVKFSYILQFVTVYQWHLQNRNINTGLCPLLNAQSCVIMPQSKKSPKILTLEPAAPQSELKMYFFSASLMVGHCSGSSDTKNRKARLQAVPTIPNT